MQVDEFGTAHSYELNAALRVPAQPRALRLPKWGQSAFHNFSAVPPGMGICHQVNLEYLARVVFTTRSRTATAPVAYPDTLVGTDSHTTMINGLGVLGWGVGGIEAEAAMLGQPVSMLVPQVVGFKLTGKLREGATATDLVLTVTEMLRKLGVVGKFVEFYGPGVCRTAAGRPRHHRQHGSRVRRHLRHLSRRRGNAALPALTGRSREQIALVEAYYKEQGLFHTADAPEAEYYADHRARPRHRGAELAGPKRPQDRVLLKDAARELRQAVAQPAGRPPMTTATARARWSAGKAKAALRRCRRARH